MSLAERVSRVPFLQDEFHEHEPAPQLRRKLIVGFDALEAQALMQAHCLVLANARVQTHGSIAQQSGLFDDGFRQGATDALAMKLRV